MVGVLQEAGEHLHLPGQHRLQPVGHVVPGRDLAGTGGEFRVRRDHAELFLPGESLLTKPVPALIEPALVPVRPLLRHVVRRVRGARREVDEERLIRHQRLLLVDPVDRPVGHVLGEVVALLRRAVGFDRNRPVVKRRRVLVGLTPDEPVEILKPAARGPGVEGAHRACLPHRDLVALAELRSGVPVQLQHLRQRRGRIGPHRAIPRRRRRDLRDPAHASRVMVTAGQQRLPRRSTQRGRMETVVPQAIASQPLGGRRTARTPERARRAEPGVVDQHDEHVGRARRWPHGRDRGERRVRILGVIGDQARVRPVRDRQIRSRQIAAHLIHPPTANSPEARSRPSAETATPLRAPPPVASATIAACSPKTPHLTRIGRASSAHAASATTSSSRNKNGAVVQTRISRTQRP